MKRKYKGKKIMKYDSFYGVCFHNYFWVLFQMWDLFPIENYHTLAQYQMM